MTMKVAAGAIAILLVAAFSVWGQSDKVSDRASGAEVTAPERRDRNSDCSITVDARTGATSDPLVYSSAEKVTVCLVNKNPFRYAYKVTINNQPFDDDAAITAFVTSALGNILPAQAGQKSETEGIELDTAQACVGEATAFLLKVQEAAAAIDQLNMSLRTLMADDASAGSLQTSAGRALVHYQRLASAGEPWRLVSESNAAMTTLTQPCRASLVNDGHLVVLRRNQTVITSFIERYDVQALGSLLQVASDPDSGALSERHELAVSKKFRGKVQVSIQRAALPPNNKEPTYEAFADISLRFGQPWFVMSSGLSFSPICNRDYQLVELRPAGTDPGTRLIPRVNSDWRLTPMIMGNINIAPVSKILMKVPMEPTLYLSIGATLANNSRGPGAEYLFGPSIGLFQSRLIVTGGLYRANVINLANGYTADTPLAVGSRTPTANATRQGLGFAITYGTFRR